MCPESRPDSCGTATRTTRRAARVAEVILSPTPTRRMLVDGRDQPAGAAPGHKSIRVPLSIIDRVQVTISRSVIPAGNCHQQRRHLLVGDAIGTGVPVDGPGDLLVGQFAAVAFVCDDRHRVDDRRHRVIRSSPPARTRRAATRRGCAGVGVVDQQIRPAVFQEHLPAPAARHQWRPVGVTDRDGPQPPTAGGHQLSHQCHLGADRESV